MLRLGERLPVHALEAPPQQAGVDDEPLTAAESSSPASRLLPGAKRLAGLLCKRDIDLDTSEGATAARVRQDSELTATHDAITAFIGLVRTKTSAGFDAGLKTSTTSGIRADYAGVRATLELQWSNAQCEGRVTRLKFLKRQMYGRTNFDLLRQRVLQTPGWSTQRAGGPPKWGQSRVTFVNA